MFNNKPIIIKLFNFTINFTVYFILIAKKCRPPVFIAITSRTP